MRNELPLKPKKGKWSYSVDCNFANAASIPTHTAGAKYGVVSPWSANTVNVTVTPKAFPESSSPPKAGSQYPGTMTVKTDTGNSAATEATRTLGIITVVPSYFTFNSIGTANNAYIPRAENSLAVTASSNDEWSATTTKPATTGGTATRTAANYSSNTLTVKVAGNTDWETSRQVILSTKYNGVTINRATYNQYGYRITAASRNLTVETGTETTTNNITLTGWFPTMDVRAGVNATDAGQVSSTTASITAYDNNTRTSGNVKIPPYEAWGNRTVYMQYKRGTNNWGNVGASATQYGYTYTSASVVGTPSFPGGAKGSATIQIKGWFPDTEIQARSGSSILEKATVTKGTDKQATISIDAVSGWDGNRTVTLGYVPANNTNGWVPLGSYTQTGYKSYCE